MASTSRHTIERFWQTANARDWNAFAALLHPDVVYLVPQTRERATGREAFVEVFRTWPGDWRANVELLIAEADTAVSTIRFVIGGDAAIGISFFELREGLVTRITDYWPADYDPPARVTPQLQRDPAGRS
jgi:ketosteroid isomerase-like protein